MKTVRFPDNALIPIVSDGAIATRELGEGRLIPVLVLDCALRLDFRELIYAHEHLPHGDVKVTWAGKRFSKRIVYLYLEFERPSAVRVLLQFDTIRQGGLIDGILHARSVYLQPKESGVRVVEGLGKSKILVEVPDTGFAPMWESLFRWGVRKMMRKSGLGAREANDATEQYLNRIREIWRQRVGGGNTVI